MKHNPNQLTSDGYRPTAFHYADEPERQQMRRAANLLRVSIADLCCRWMDDGAWQIWIKPTPVLFPTNKLQTVTNTEP